MPAVSAPAACHCADAVAVAWRRAAGLSPFGAAEVSAASPAVSADPAARTSDQKLRAVQDTLVSCPGLGRSPCSATMALAGFAPANCAIRVSTTTKATRPSSRLGNKPPAGRGWSQPPARWCRVAGMRGTPGYCPASRYRVVPDIATHPMSRRNGSVFGAGHATLIASSCRLAEATVRTARHSTVPRDSRRQPSASH